MARDTVADKRDHPFFTIDNAIVYEYGPKIGSNALALYIILACHAKNAEHTCFPSIRTLMKEMLRSRDVVFQTIDTLKSYGLITVEQRKDPESENLRSNLYTLLPVPKPSPNSVLGDPNSVLGSPDSRPPLVHIADDPSPDSRPPLVRYSDSNKTKLELDEVNETNLNKTNSFADTPARKSRAGTPPTAEVWESYRSAYSLKYATDPVRNAKVNGQIANFVGRIGIEAAIAMASWFLSHQGSWYCQQKHSMDSLLHDCEKLHTEWKTGSCGSPANVSAVGAHIIRTEAKVKVIQARQNANRGP